DYFYFHPDHLGSSSYITNAAATVSQHMEYLPFGETLVDEHTNSYNSPFKYNGKEFDEETGNYFYGARYYDPRLSIFISVDPLAEQAPDWTPYRYGFNNPIKYTDPTGMFEDPVYGSDGTYRGTTNEGFTGKIIIYDGNKDFSNIDAVELLFDESFDVSKQRGDANIYDAVRNELSGNAKSKIWTHVASQMEGQQVYDEVFTMNDLEGGKIHFDSKIGVNWEASYSLGAGKGKISGSDRYNYETTVENIQSSIIVHEWYSHIKKNQGDGYGSHRLA